MRWPHHSWREMHQSLRASENPSARTHHYAADFKNASPSGTTGLIDSKQMLAVRGSPPSLTWCCPSSWTRSSGGDQGWFSDVPLWRRLPPACPCLCSSHTTVASSAAPRCPWNDCEGSSHPIAIVVIIHTRQKKPKRSVFADLQTGTTIGLSLTSLNWPLSWRACSTAFLASKRFIPCRAHAESRKKSKFCC